MWYNNKMPHPAFTLDETRLCMALSAVVKNREHVRRYNAANPQRHRAAVKAWRQNNRAKLKAYRKQHAAYADAIKCWRQAHPEKVREFARAWAERNAGKL